MSSLRSTRMNVLVKFFALIAVVGLVYSCQLPDVGPDPTLSVFVPADEIVDFGEEVTLFGSASHSENESVDILWEVISQPSGSALILDNATENSITFLPEVIGEYVLRFTATSVDGLTEFEEVIITVIKAAVRLSGLIDSDRVIENIYDDPADPDYIVSGILRMDADVIIEDDVRIVFEDDAGLSILPNGSLVAVGSESKPIIMTGIQQTAGAWKGVNLNSRNPNNELAFVTIEYAGGGGFDGANEKANLTLEDAIVKVSNSKLINGEGTGLLVRNKDSQLPEFTGNEISGNASSVRLSKTQFHYLDETTNFSGNNEDFIQSEGQNALLEDVTWKPLNVPYRLRAARELIESELTLEKGTKLIALEGSEIHITENGSIVALGTEVDPIILEGHEDTPGYWKGIEIFSNSDRNEFDYVTIKNGGSGQFKANLTLRNKAKLKLSNSQLNRSIEYGLHIPSEDAQLTLFTNNSMSGNRVPVQCLIRHFHFFDEDSDFTGNTIDVLNASGTNSIFESDVNWKKVNVPYQINSVDQLRSRITIQPGVEIIFFEDSGIEIFDGGSLFAIGTEMEPITFRGLEDVQGYWNGIRILSKSDQNQLSQVEIRNGGGKPFNGAKANIHVGRDALLTITNSLINRSGGFGIGVGEMGILTESENIYSNNVDDDIYFE